MVGHGTLRSLLLAATAIAALPAAAAAQTARDGGQVEEVVVTASKTGQDLKKIAGSVSALTGADLQKIGAQSAEDYLPFTPGVVFNSAQPGFSTVTIRGVNTTASFASITEGTTGIYVNDVPLTDPFFSSGTPDVDTFDVRDIQVYRGPQGTLFGSASMGGAVDYIANSPNLRSYEAELQGTLSGTSSAGTANGALRGMFNIPVVNDTFAIRAVGIYRSDAGYIDNVGTGQDDSNSMSILGGRLMATWQMAPDTKLSAFTLYQKTTSDDLPYIDPSVGGLRKDTGVAEPSRTTVWINNLRLDQGLGFATLSVLGSYHEKTGFTDTDGKRFSAFGFDKAFFTDREKSRGYDIEARLTSPRGQRLEWVLGAFYNHTTEDIAEQEFASNAGAVADALAGPGSAGVLTMGDQWGLTTEHFVGQEEALFGEATLHITDPLKLTVGGRLFRTTADYSTFGSGLLYVVFVNGMAVNAPPPGSESDHGFIPKVSLAYDLTPDASVYVLASKGFRFGGININPDPGLPMTYGSDSVWNYEAGFKSSWLDRRLSLDVDAFEIDWSDIQLSVTTPLGTQGIVNAGSARIRGGEASLNWRITPGLSWTSSLTYADAKLTSVTGATGLAFSVAPGATLPGTSKWLASNILRYDWDGPYHPFVSASYRYASEAPALLQHYPLQNPKIGGYNLVDLRAGFTLHDVQISAFVDNLTDDRAILSATYTGNFGNTVNDFIARPRTIGINVDWRM